MKTKKILLLLTAMLSLTACEKVNETELQEPEQWTDVEYKYSKKFTFTLKGDFGAANFTRAYLQADGQSMTDLWVYDYMDGQLIQSLHQSPTDETWGTPQLSLPYGKHHVYFVASRGDGPSVDTDTHTIIWTTPRDAFWKDYEVEVVNTTNGNRAVTLDRVATKLRLLINDEVPTGCAFVNVTPDRWFYGLDYVTGNPVSAKKQTRSVSVPATYIGTEGQLAVNIFGLSGSDEWVTNIEVTATDNNGNVIGSATIPGAPFKANRSTEYTGNLFGSDGALDVTVNGDWESPKTGTW